MVTAPETRARRKIREAVEKKGWTLTLLTWEPWGASVEKGGIEGGWYGECRAPSGGEDWVMGLDWREAAEWAEKRLAEDKTSHLGSYP